MQKNRYSEIVYVCAFCGEQHKGLEMQYMGKTKPHFFQVLSKNESNHICIKCLHTHFEKCHCCKKYYFKNETVGINCDDYKYCISCYIKNRDKFVQCQDCGKHFEKNCICNIKNSFNNNINICYKCITNYHVCKKCCRYQKGSINFDNKYCDSCTNQAVLFVQPYSFKPSPIFLSFENNMVQESEDCSHLYFGVELELGSCDNCRHLNYFCFDTLKKTKNHVYMKRDGSIFGIGCETVTHPATFDFHNNTNFWDIVMQNAQKNKLKPNSSTGIHVHMNRSFFKQRDIAKMDQFINSFQDFFISISNRESRYARYIMKAPQYWGTPDDRYRALNLTNRDTIELRIFESTNDADKMRKYIKLCDALAHFSKMIDCVNENTLINFKKYLVEKYDFEF